MKELVNFRRNGEAFYVFKKQAEFCGNAFLPKKAFVPISINKAQATPIVNYGQHVQEGELIAKASGTNSTNVYSPVPGVVGSIFAFQTDFGKKFVCLPILLGGRFNVLSKQKIQYPWNKTSGLELLRIIDNKGLIITEKPHMPLATTLRTAMRKNVQCLKFALFDFDKSCGLEGELLKHFFFEVLEGLAIIARILGCNNIQFYYSHNSTKPADLQEKLIPIFDFVELNFSFVKNNYPFYDETTNQDNLPALSILPSTAIHVYEAVVKNKPFVGSYILLSGKALKQAKLLKVRFGTSIENLIEECGGITMTPAALIINGYLEGVVSHKFDMPTNKTMKSITVVPSKDIKKSRIFDCDNCGKCIQACPMHLNPAMLIRKIKRNDFDEDVLMQLKTCIKCSICSSCCSCRIPVAKIIKETKERMGLE